MPPPTNTLSIVFQLAIPVISRMAAPMNMAITLVSPTLPGMRPTIESMCKKEEEVPEIELNISDLAQSLLDSVSGC